MNTLQESQPRHPLRERLALLSYWLLFILIPPIGFLVWRGITAESISAVFPLFLVLAFIGEHALRPWRRLWRLP